MGNLVVKSNAFVGASYGLGVVEQRLILLAILKARETNSVSEAISKTLIIRASDYMTHFGVDRATAYESLENAVNGLYESEYRFIEILPNGEQETHRERFVSGVSYSEGSGLVKLKFTPETVPLVVGLSKNYTKYEIEQVSRLSSQYALRLYEILAQWRTKGKCVLELAELRFKFGLLDDEYSRMDNFKRKVLDFAVNEINEHTDLAVSYEQHKQGRKIVGFTFLITQKSKKGNTSGRKTDEHTLDLFDNLTDLERQTIRQRIDEHIKRLEQQGETVGEWHRENITKKAIAERWGLDVLAEQQRKETERQTRLAAEQAEMQAKARAEQEKAEQAEKRRNAMIAKFETLAPDEQEQVLNQVGEIVGGVLGDFYKTARQQGAAHKDPRFVSWFFKILGC